MTQAQAKQQRELMESSAGNQIERIPSEKVNFKNASKNKDSNSKKHKPTSKKEGKTKKKKKRSGLAFWFCMSTKTDTLDRDAQPFPAPKSKSKDKKESKDKLQQKRSENKENERKSRSDKSSKQQNNNKDKRHQRHSAPPAEWLSMMAALQEAEGTSGAGGNNSQQQQSRSRSGSTSGVRYRFDGTLERPYVYPGGLTFKGDTTKKNKKVKKSSKRGSKKGGAVVEADVHQTNEGPDGMHDVFYSTDDDDDDDDDEYLDDSDIRKQFYLRYDSNMRKKQRYARREHRYSMPADLHLSETGGLGERYGHGESRWMEQKEPGHEDDMEKRKRMVNQEKEKEQELEEEYDEPYESEHENQNEAVEGQSPKRSRPCSYYSSPERTSEMVYMWHSCEDLRHCDHMYHSEEEIRRSKEELPLQSDLDPNPKKGKHQGTGGDRDYDPNIHKGPNSSPHYKNKVHNIDKSHHSIEGAVVSDCSQPSYSPSTNYDHKRNSQQPSSQYSYPNHHRNHPNNYVGEIQTPQNRHRDDAHSHSASRDSSSSSYQTPLSHSLELNKSPRKEKNYVKATKSFDNPFKRNVGRASCMPGNKRFFLPPPPNYTPPREEFAVAQAEIAEQERLEKQRKNSCTRGSQTDLTEDFKDDFIDMVDRDQRGLSCSPTRNENNSSFKDSFLLQGKEIERDYTNVRNGSLSSQSNSLVPENSVKTPSRKTGSVDLTKENAKHKAASNSFTFEDVEYMNLKDVPKSTASISTLSSSSSLSQDQSVTSPRRQGVVTSTPKSQRRSELTVATQPVPTPRQRSSSSCQEYSSVSFVSQGKYTNTEDKSSGPQRTSNKKHPILTSPLPWQLDHSSSQNVSNRKEEKVPHENQQTVSVSDSASSSKAALPRERPVAKKRRSQLLMMHIDSSYTTADIEEGLGEKNESDSSSAVVTSPCVGTSKLTARRELFSKGSGDGGSKASPDDKKTAQSFSQLSKSSALDIMKEEETRGNCQHSSKTGSKDDVMNSNNNHSNKEPGQDCSSCVVEKNSYEDADHSKECSLPPLRRFQLARSPTASRRFFNANSPAISSSVECLTAASTASPALTRTYYSGLSSSLADLPSLMEPSSPEHPFQLFSLLDHHLYDQDDRDDENADDEMSVYNEDSPMPKTPSLEDLLRKRSILDRSQAVARKRRQRMRDRKCRSQLILSSTEVDDYYRNDVTNRRRPSSRHSSKQKHVTTSISTTTNTTATATTTTSSTVAKATAAAAASTAFSFDTPIVPYSPRRALQRQNKLLNHTDSGMDSDGASPLNSRDFHQHGSRGDQDQHNNLPVNPQLSWTGRNTFEEPLSQRRGDGGGNLGTLSNRKSWEARFYERQGLRKYRSKEFLAYSSNSQHFDRRVYVSNGFETLV